MPARLYKPRYGGLRNEEENGKMKNKDKIGQITTKKKKKFALRNEI